MSGKGSTPRTGISSTPRTPVSKYRSYRPTPSSSKTHVSEKAIFTPTKKRSRQEVALRERIEDESMFPPGYTLPLMDTHVESPDPWKTAIMRKKFNEEPEMDIVEILSRPPIKSDRDKLSLVAQFDDYVRAVKRVIQNDLTPDFLQFAIYHEECRKEWSNAVKECKRLRCELDGTLREIGDYFNKLNHARRLLDQEKKLRRRAEEERDNLEQQMALARDLLFSDKCQNRLPEDTREKLSFLHASAGMSQRNTLGTGSRLNTISEVNSQELNSTGSLLSELSYSRSEDDLDVSAFHAGRKWKKHQPVPAEDAPASKRSKTSSHQVEIQPNDVIVSTTRLSMTRDGPITATSTIEAVPSTEILHKKPETTESRATNEQKEEIIEVLRPKYRSPGSTKFSSTSNLGRTSCRRQHTFVPKTVIKPDTCGPCQKRIRFGKIVLRCKECKGVCHTECKDKLPLPCIPMMNTPTSKGMLGTVADYVPTLPPMVPALIIHCLNEIELRGLDEVGIYRVPGSEKEVRTLKEKFLKAKYPPVLNDVDVHVMCGVVKDFLRSLHEPLVTYALWKDFIAAAEATDVRDIAPTIYQAISQLPQPNRDTLAYVMLHLQKVAESPACKMPASNLSKIFGPTIIGYSSDNPDPYTMLNETHLQARVMQHLMNIPSDFWSTYVNIDSKVTTPRTNKLLQTPSTESLQRTRRGFFNTPYSARSGQSTRKKKFFGTPPNK